MENLSSRKTSRRPSAGPSGWLADRLGLKALFATGPAPIWSAAEDDPALVSRLEKLDRSIDVEDLCFAPDLRYECAAEPLGVRLLRQHEGIAPGCPAVLCPGDVPAISRLTGVAANCGLEIAFGRHGSHNSDALPVSFHRMNAVESEPHSPGLVRFERGASWQDIQAVSDIGAFCIPAGIMAVYQTPACAAASGAFSARVVESISGEPCVYEMHMPPPGSLLLDGTWLFDSPAKARDAFTAVCRKVPPLHGQLIGEADLRIGEEIGIWRLPRRLFAQQQKRFTAVRLAYLGTNMTARMQRFASTFTVEAAGGKFWRNGALLNADERLRMLLENGLTEITIAGDSDIADRFEATAADERSTQSVVTRRHFFTDGHIHREVSLIVPRDFTDPLGQWRSIAATALPADEPEDTSGNGDNAASTVQDADEAGGMPVSESAEWKAIRAALLPAGDAGPPAPDLAERAQAAYGDARKSDNTGMSARQA